MKKNNPGSGYSNLLNKYISDINTEEFLKKEAQRTEFLNKNFQAGWLDILFPYHMKTIELDDETQVYTTLKFYARQKAFLIWLHNSKFDKMLSQEERAVRDQKEQTQFNINIGLKSFSALLLF